MTMTDDDFREMFKPVQVPAHYLASDTDENKIVFALAEIGSGTVNQVVEELKKLDSAIDTESYMMIAESFLNDRYEKGLLGGEEKNGSISYDLKKITHANSGTVNPGLLAPGLD